MSAGEIALWLVRALLVIGMIAGGALGIRGFVTQWRRALSGRETLQYLRSSGLRLLRGVPCRFDGPWWWLAWGTKWAWRDLDLWLAPSGVVIVAGRGSALTQLALRGAASLPGSPMRVEIERAELFGDEVRLVFADGAAPAGAAFLVRPSAAVDREAVSAVYVGAHRVEPSAARTR